MPTEGSNADTGNGAGETLFVNLGGTGDPVLLPGGNEALQGDFAREGFDLHIELPGGDTIVVVDFFAGGPDALATLMTEGGARILGETAAKLAGPETAGQIAQSDGIASDASAFGEAVGTIDAMKGTATVIRADGTEEPLEAGSQIYENDTIVTGTDSALGVLFVDDSTMSMGSQARIVVDQMVYDDSNQSGNQLFDVVQGAFVFASGHIGKTNPEDVEVRTPVATIGIRGTKYGVNVGAEDGETTVTLFEGAVTVRNAGGEQVLSSVGQTTYVAAYDIAPSDVTTMDPLQQARMYGEAIAFSPDQPSLNRDGQDGESSDGETGDQAVLDDSEMEKLADQLNDVDTAAGPSGAIAAVTKSAAFLRLLNGLLEGSGSLQSGTLANDNDDGRGAYDYFTGLDDRYGDNDSFVPSAGPGAPLGPSGPISSSPFNDSLPNAPFSGRYAFRYDPSNPVVGTVVGSSGPGKDIFTISMSQSAVPTGWTVGQDASGNVIITESNGTIITMSEVEEFDLDLGTGNDSASVGDLSNTDIINETVLIDGGAGNDSIDASATDKRVVADGGAGNDVIRGGDYAGGDTTSVYSGDNLTGGSGADVIYGNAGNDLIDGGTGNDLLYGGTGDDIILGGDGDDTIDGGAGGDAINAGAGNDTILYRVGDGADVIDGGAGNDRVVVSYTAADLTDPDILQALAALHSGQQGTFPALGLTLSGIETITIDGPQQDTTTALSLAAGPANEDESIPVTIGLSVATGAAMQTIVTLDGVPEGYVLTNAAGDNFPGGTAIDLTPDQLAGLAITPPANVSADFTLSVSATTTSLLTGGTSSAAASAVAVVAPVPDTPSVVAEDAAGVEGNAGDDLLEGTDGDDVLTGGAGNDTLTGGAGDDVLTGDGSNAATLIPLTIEAGAGEDIDGSESLALTFTLPAGVVLTDAQGTPYDIGHAFAPSDLDGLQALVPAGLGDFTIGITTTVTDIDQDGGSDTATFTDSLTVTIASGNGPGDDVLDGGTGADTLIAGDGDDTLSLTIDPDAGRDIVDGGAGSDALNLTLTVGPTDLIYADIVSDIIALHDWIASGPGPEEVRVFETLNLRVQGVESLTVLGLEGEEIPIDSLRVQGVDIIAGDSDDTIGGTDNADTIDGGGGNDVIDGGGGGDTLYGAEGDDILLGGDDDDALYGGGGNDTLTGGGGSDVLDGGEGDDVLDGGTGGDTLYGAEGDDTLIGSDDDDELYGGGGDDTLTGGGGNDVLDGGEGDDVLDGGTGNDTLRGGDGNDTLHGSDGDDVIDGDAGDDVLTGGGGNDTLRGGDGDDTAIFNFAQDGPGVTYDGGDGYDTLRIELSTGMDALEQAIAEIAEAIKAAKLDPSALQSVESIGLDFQNVEDVQLFVDGTEKTFSPTVTGLEPLVIDTDALFAGTPVARDIAIQDADSPTLMQASVTISQGMQAGDALTIDAGVLQATGLEILSAGPDGEGNFTLVLSGDAPVAAYEEALSAIRLVNDDDAPEPGARTISIAVTDDDGISSEAAETGVAVEPSAAEIADSEGAQNDSVAFVTEADGEGAVVSGLAEITEPQTTIETLTITVARTGNGAQGGEDDDDGEWEGFDHWFANQGNGGGSNGDGNQGQGSNGRFEVIVNGISLGIFIATVAHGQLGEWGTVEIGGIEVTEGETVDIEIKAVDSASNVLVNRIELGDRVFEAEDSVNLTGGSVHDDYVALSGGTVGFSVAVEAPDTDAFDTWLLRSGNDEDALSQEDLDQLFDGIDMGAGHDWVAAAAGVENTLEVDLGGDVWTGADHVAGGAGDDVIIGNDAANILAGGDGNDRLVAKGGDDLLLGGAGDDVMEVSGDDLSAMGGQTDFGARHDSVDQALDANSTDGIEGLDRGRSGLDGGSGRDTLKVTNGPTDGSIDSEDVTGVENIEALDIVNTGGQTNVNLSLEDIISMTDENNELTILKGQDDTVKIDGQEYGASDEFSLMHGDIAVKITIEETEQVPDAS
ncbi:FecR domain-containing protein [Marivibrio halodurans]|nr:FecR domain-containing protein [Marivibrio halodurans]